MTIYRTVEGLELTIRPVSMVLVRRIQQAVERKLRAEGLPLDPPTYTVTTAVGQEETYPLDAEAAETDAQKAELAAYEAASQRLANETNEKTQRVFFLRGLVTGDVPDTWVDEMKGWGLEMPADKDDLKLEYIQVELLKTVADIKAAVMEIMQLSMTGVEREALGAAEATFRDLLERDPASAASGEVAARKLELQPSVPGGAGGADVGRPAVS